MKETQTFLYKINILLETRLSNIWGLYEKENNY